MFLLKNISSLIIIFPAEIVFLFWMPPNPPTFICESNPLNVSIETTISPNASIFLLHFSNDFLLSNTSYYYYQKISKIDIYQIIYCQITLYRIAFYRIVYFHIVFFRIASYRPVYYHKIINRILIYWIKLVNICYRLRILAHFLFLWLNRSMELLLLTILTFIVL